MLDLEAAGYHRSQVRFGWENENPPDGEPTFVPAERVTESEGCYFVYPERWKREDVRFLADLERG